MLVMLVMYAFITTFIASLAIIQKHSGRRAYLIIVSGIVSLRLGMLLQEYLSVGMK